jgi:hypothetical protein
MNIYRVRPETGEHYFARRNKNGKFELGDPALGREKHHTKNRIEVHAIEEVARLVRSGFSLRMRGNITNQWNMITPSKIIIVDA